jgi:predicted porin
VIVDLEFITGVATHNRQPASITINKPTTYKAIFMNKSLILFATLSAIASAASAQSNVTIYGLADVGIDRQTGGVTGSITKVSSGIQNGSRFGFKGNEDLGGGLSALFVLEGGIGLDTGASLQSGLLFGRQALVGLKSNLGAITLGRQYTAINNSLCSDIDPFQCSLSGHAFNMLSAGGTPTNGGNGSRTNNAIKYTSPGTTGFNGELTYGFGEVAAHSSYARTIGGSIGYAAGPLSVKLAHNSVNNATATQTAKVTLLGGKYNFGVVAVNLGYAVNKNAFAGNSSVPMADSRQVITGATVPVGAGTVILSFIKNFDRTVADNDASQAAIGYTYALSKRSNLYTSYARTNNTRPNTAGNAGGFFTVGNASDGGSGDRSFNVGIRHIF